MTKEEYEEFVIGAGDDIINNLDADADDLDEELSRQFHSLGNEYRLVIDEDKAIDVLRLSNYPTMEFFIHGLPLKDSELQYGKAAFPFCSCAAAAFSADIREYLQEQYDFDGPLTRETVLQAKVTLDNLMREGEDIS